MGESWAILHKKTHCLIGMMAALSATLKFTFLTVNLCQLMLAGEAAVREIRHPDGQLETFIRSKNFWGVILGIEDQPEGLRVVRATNERILVKNVYSSNELKDCDIVKSKDEIQEFIREFQSGTPSLEQKEDSKRRSRINFSKLRKDCAKFHNALLDGGKETGREKRSLLIFPGTNWCGKGNKAEYVSDFGSAAKTDKCCLEHDGCPYIIQGLTTNFNYFNYRFHTLSYCDCDRRFRECLKEARSGSANLLGKVYFSVVNSQCFVLEREKSCAKRSWWGSCNKWRYQLVAHVRDSGSWS